MASELHADVLGEIRRVASSGSLSVSLHVARGVPASSLGQRLADVALTVERGTGGLLPASVEESEDPSQLPVMSVRVGGAEVLRYHAVPEGPELAPFEEGLLECARSYGAARPDLPDLPPTDLTVFIAAACPNCPTAVRAATALAVCVPGTSVTIIDVAEDPDRADRIGVRSVPTIVSRNGLTLVGAISVEELADRLASASGPESDGGVFDSLVDAGRFDAAGEMLASGRARMRFCERWLRSGMEGRIGLVLAADEALQRAAEALDPIVPELLEQIGAGDSARRGDTIDLLGRIAHPVARPALEALTADMDEDVAEAASDALAALDERARRPTAPGGDAAT